MVKTCPAQQELQIGLAFSKYSLNNGRAKTCYQANEIVAFETDPPIRLKWQAIRSKTSNIILKRKYIHFSP